MCATADCSAKECCTTLRPTCGDTKADGSRTVYDCSVAQKYLNHEPTRTFCGQRGCSMLECCTADTPAGPAPPSPPSQDGSKACTSYEGLQTLLNEVDRECCDGLKQDCSSGYPSTCDAQCAAVLLPMQATCAEFLSSSTLLAPAKVGIDTAAAACPQATQCSTFTDVTELLGDVHRACCDGLKQDCSSGYPSTCDAQVQQCFCRCKQRVQTTCPRVHC